MELHDVRSLKVDGRFHVVLAQGVEESVEIEVPDHVWEKISMKQGGKTFSLSAKDKDTRSYRPFGVRITLKSPEQIVLKGATQAEVSEILTCRKLDLQLLDEAMFKAEIRSSESVSIKMEGHAGLQASINAVKSCRIELSDYASVTATGYVPSVNLKQCQTSKLDGKDFRTDRLDAKLSNTARGSVTVNKLLVATVQDAAVLLYEGMPKTKVTTSGVAKVAPFDSDRTQHPSGRPNPIRK